MKRALSVFLCACVLCAALFIDISAYDTAMPGSFATVSAGMYHTAAIDANGDLWTWGSNQWGQLGDGTYADSKVPVKVMENVVSVSLGPRTTAALKRDGTLWMWGSNRDHEMGYPGEGVSFGPGFTEEMYQRVTIPEPVRVMENVSAVSLGFRHGAAIKTDGTLWTWGFSADHGVGYPKPDDMPSDREFLSCEPHMVMQSVAAVCAGWDTTAAIKQDGSLWMWGDNNVGQFGNGRVTDRLSSSNGDRYQSMPLKVLEGVAAVSLGSYHTAVIKNDLTLWVAGNGSGGALGLGDDGAQYFFVKAADNVKYVNAGWDNTAFIKTDGTLWVCGGSALGKLGTGSANDGIAFEPLKTLDNISSVVFGEGHAIARRADGAVLCWGANTYGQVGNGGAGANFGTIFDEGRGRFDILAVPEPSVISLSERSPLPFGDVQKSDYFFEPVKWAVENGVTSGVSADSFAPSQSCTRAQAVTFLWRAAGCPEPQGAGMPFDDVRADAYYSKAVMWANENGIVHGTGALSFSPEEPCTRAQIVTFLYRLAGKPETDSESGFSDVDAAAYYKAAVAWAVKNAVTRGTGEGRFGPDELCTRAQIVTFLFRDFAE